MVFGNLRLSIGKEQSCLTFRQLVRFPRRWSNTPTAGRHLLTGKTEHASTDFNLVGWVLCRIDWIGAEHWSGG